LDITGNRAQAAEWLRSADNHCNAGAFDKARQVALRVLEQSPENGTAEFILALCDENAGELLGAIVHCRTALDRETGNREYQRKLAELMTRSGELEEARRLCTELVRQDNRDREALFRLADLCRSMGDVVSEFVYLCQLKRNKQLPKQSQPRIVSVLESIPRMVDYPEMEADLLDFLGYDNINKDRINGVIGTFICSKYGLESEHPQLDLGDLVNDPLLNKALRNLVFISPKIEELLTTLRRSMLIEAAENQYISAPVIPFVEAVALQNKLNEYVHFVSVKEREILDLFEQLLESQARQENWHPKHSELPLLCLAMYRQLHDLPVKDLLLEHSVSDWPESLQILAQTALFDIEEELKTVERITSLTGIEDDTSKLVQSQYEDNPYPRWRGIHHTEPMRYGQYMSAILPDYRPPERLLDEGLDILVAGCGTGSNPIGEALKYPGARITAIDISRRSLAFALQKARELGVGKVEFHQGDILELDSYDRHFDVVVCAGVLHHMADPMRGWKVLRGLLAPEGVMRIALYSRIARREIIRQREIIAQLDMEPTPENIRRYRQTILGDESAKGITGCTDFWSLSEARDLLFHWQEHQFSLPEIQQCCDQLELSFIGLHAGRQVYATYRKRFPDDRLCRDLDNWHRIEIDNPDLFMGMYDFWCGAAGQA